MPGHATRATVELTDEMIEAGKSDAGGWNREQLALIGVAWPPPKGWKRSVLGKHVERETLERFLALTGGGDAVDQLSLF